MTLTLTKRPLVVPLYTDGIKTIYVLQFSLVSITETKNVNITYKIYKLIRKNYLKH